MTLFAIVAASACANEESSPSCSVDWPPDEDVADDDRSARRPFRDQWRVAADVAFPTETIASLEIGGRLTNDNFANRGDVIVKYDGAPGRILIEMRRFTHTTDAEQAARDFEKLSLWAFSSSLGRPQDQAPEDACIEGEWHDGCKVRVYYDGLSQLTRAGADLRVTLPPDYHHPLVVTTEDDVADGDYSNRADVCIEGLAGSARVETMSGSVWVSMARDMTPAPTCSPEQIAACEQWTVVDDRGAEVPAPWSSECDCLAADGFGHLSIANREFARSNVMVDAPEGLWATVHAENLDPTQTRDGEHCVAEISLADAEIEPASDDWPWLVDAAVAYPGPPALRGGGFRIQLASSGCGTVASTSSPEDFVGQGRGDEQPTQWQGDLAVCTGCIPQSCDELVP